jgi:hypothetical protein
MEAAQVLDDDGDVPDLFFAGALIYKRDENGDLVPTWRYRVEPFQRAILESGMTIAEVARAAGIGGDSYLSRMLGFRDHISGHNRRRYRAQSIGYANAKKLAKALDLDLVYWEI